MNIRKILLVDDSSTDLNHLRESVTELGSQIITASSGEEAVLKCKDEQPDVVLMDIVMGDFDGYKACREITKNDTTKDIPIIFITSKKNRADRIWAERQGARAMITKPYTKQDILDQLQHL